MPKDLRSFLKEYTQQFPDDIVQVDKQIDSKLEITALVEHLEKLSKWPLLYFTNALDAEGKTAGHKFVCNVLGSRTRYARICNSSREGLGKMVFQMTREKRMKPVTVSKSEAPCKEVIKTGNDINLFELPISWHNWMDAGPYFSGGFMTSYDPDTGIDNCALIRGWVKEKDTCRGKIAPRPAHNGWNLWKQEQKNEPLKVAYWVGHHPLAYIGGLAKLPYPSSHWEAIGGCLGEPLRLVPSESLGDDFLVPADAEVIVEALVEPNKRYAEGPFGEFPFTFGPQILNPQWKVTAITHRKDPIWYSITAAHVEHPSTGAPPFEGLIWDLLSQRFPNLVNVFMPLSGVGRYHVYIQMKDPGPGEARQAGLMALAAKGEFLKHAFIFDEDVDIFDPKEVMWAIATRSQWSEDVIILPNTKNIMLDPSSPPERVGDGGVIDCTKPFGEPFEVRVWSPKEISEKVKLEDFVSKDVIDRIQPEKV